MSEYTLAQAQRDILALNDNVIGQLNRIGALEAMVHELLHHAPTEMIESMVRTYDVQTTLAMGQMDAKYFREHLWSHFHDTMAEIVSTRKLLAQAPERPEK